MLIQIPISICALVLSSSVELKTSYGVPPAVFVLKSQSVPLWPRINFPEVQSFGKQLLSSLHQQRWSIFQLDKPLQSSFGDGCGICAGTLLSVRQETDDESALHKAEEPGAIVFRQITTGRLCVYALCEEENGAAKRYREKTNRQNKCIHLEKLGDRGSILHSPRNQNHLL